MNCIPLTCELGDKRFQFINIEAMRVWYEPINTENINKDEVKFKNVEFSNLTEEEKTLVKDGIKETIYSYMKDDAPIFEGTTKES